jgi:hypothetical protein
VHTGWVVPIDRDDPLLVERNFLFEQLGLLLMFLHFERKHFCSAHFLLYDLQSDLLVGVMQQLLFLKEKKKF